MNCILIAVQTFEECRLVQLFVSPTHRVVVLIVMNHRLLVLFILMFHNCIVRIIIRQDVNESTKIATLV